MPTEQSNTTGWWITSGPLGVPSTEKVIGPFESMGLALRVRVYVESAEQRSDLWVQHDPEDRRP